jgi:outer membrane protein, adhesin transport system
MITDPVIAMRIFAVSLIIPSIRGRRGWSVACGIVLVSTMIGAAMPAMAQQALPDLLPALLERHPRVKAARADRLSVEQQVRVARGGWFPTAQLQGGYGHEDTDIESVGAASLPTRDASVQVDQLLWDFGATNAQIDTVRTQLRQTDAILSVTEQGILLEGATAYIDLTRAYAVYDFAIQSEANIRKQTGLEESRVEAGSGIATDVLQAKTQLAGAEARRVSAEGLLAAARNRFRAVFKADPPAHAELQPVFTPEAVLPERVDDAVDIMLDSNPQLAAARLAVEAADRQVDAARATGFAPRLSAQGKLHYKQDYSGTAGRREEALAKVQLTFPFNLGMTASNTLEAARQTASAADNRQVDQRDLLEEQVRNAWTNLATARQVAGFLGNQANIAAQFVDLARRERQLGQRSLIDVLSGETALINARSDAASAQADIQIAAYTLLTAMGQLNIAAFAPSVR